MPTLKSSFRVYIEDTDVGGVVYHANYLKFAERARTEYLRSSGIEQSRLIQAESILFLVYHLDVHFLASAKLDDLLTIETTITELRLTRMKMKQSIFCEEKKLGEITSSIACVNLERKPTRWPQYLSDLLQSRVSPKEMPE